ncbi:MAG: hypothetical protein AseanaTS_26260 [Candidatus Pelagadaptatus aseana]|uniref:hypothetical protein n=1 Tax=Candidatus Pelagadaptatus aseana TaxID=3120508 RepID=UPI0039B2927F
MKKPMKYLLTATLITASATTALASSYDDKDEYRDCDSRKYGKMMKHHGGFMGNPHNPREMMTREFNAEEINTLMQAKLLMRGNDNLKVGKIEPTPNGYTVAIVTRDNSLVEELELAPNGMPLKRFEHIKERMEKHSER